MTKSVTVLEEQLAQADQAAELLAALEGVMAYADYPEGAKVTRDIAAIIGGDAVDKFDALARARAAIAKAHGGREGKGQ